MSRKYIVSVEKISLQKINCILPTEEALLFEQFKQEKNFDDILKKFRKEAVSGREKGDKFESLIKGYLLTDKKHSAVIDGIDKAISQLQKNKDNLLALENNLRIANNKADEITIKKLTHKNPTMKEKFADNEKQ